MLFKKKEEKPKYECNHIYCQFVTMDDPKRMTTDVFMKCIECEETTKISTTGALANLFKYYKGPVISCKDCDGYEAGYSAGLKDAEKR